MAIRKQRGPRPGEILAFVSGRRGMTWKAEDGKSGPHVRVAPAPCCANQKRGGSATINTASGLWSCFACGSRGNWFGFTKRAGFPLSDPYEDCQPVDFKIYDAIRARVRRAVSRGHHPALLSACEARGIRPETLDAWKVTSCGPDSIRIPLFGLTPDAKWLQANARVRRVLGRDEATGPADWFEVKGGPTNLAMGNHLLGRDPVPERQTRPFWLRDWLDPGKLAPQGASASESLFAPVRRVLVLEGQWDAMTAWQLGIPNVLSLPNGANAVDVSGLLRYVPDDAEVWLGVDMDDAGDRAAELFFAQIGTKMKRLRLPFKDLNEWLLERPTLTADEVLATASSEPDVLPSLTLDQETEEAGRAAEIVSPTPWPKLTHRLSGGFRAGQTTGLLAPSGTGKTSLANNVIAEAVRSGVKVGVIQLESTRGENVAKLKRQIGGWIQPDEPEELRDYLRQVVMSPLIGKEVKVDDTIKEAERLMKDGCRLVVVDNWDYISKPGLGGNDKARGYGEFQELCKLYGVHGFVVWQPGKVDRGETINSGSQKGYSTFLQDADVYMTLNKQGLARRLEVEKARVDELDEESSIIWLRWDRDRSSLVETENRSDLKAITSPETL